MLKLLSGSLGMSSSNAGPRILGGHLQMCLRVNPTILSGWCTLSEIRDSISILFCELIDNQIFI